LFKKGKRVKHSKIVVVIVILSFISNQLFAGGIDLTGAVTTSNGIGIIGATVELVTAGLSTTTDSLGRYTLESVSEVVPIENQGVSYLIVVTPPVNN